METLMRELSELLESKNREINTLKWRIESLQEKLKKYEGKNE